MRQRYQQRRLRGRQPRRLLAEIGERGRARALEIAAIGREREVEGEDLVLAEALLDRIIAARDTAVFTVSPRRVALEPGDLLAVPADVPGGTVLRRIDRINWQAKSRRNVAHHYDLGDRLYDLFLDADRQYSCGYFTDAANGLEQAQLDKKAHIAAKLALEPGQRVLDIGCGWGGMALYLHRIAGVDVLGVTAATTAIPAIVRSLHADGSAAAGSPAALLEEAFRGVVVVRGSEPKPVREQLTLTLPPQAAEQVARQQAAREEQA